MSNILKILFIFTLLQASLSQLEPTALVNSINELNQSIEDLNRSVKRTERTIRNADLSQFQTQVDEISGNLENLDNTLKFGINDLQQDTSKFIDSFQFLSVFITIVLVLITLCNCFQGFMLWNNLTKE